MNIFRLTALSLFLLAVTPQLLAQSRGEASDADAPVRVLEIQDGRVWLDGDVLPSASVPVGLDLNGIEMTYHFSGPVTPVLEIDGEVYVLDGNELIRMADAEPNRANVYFLGQPEMAARPAPPEPASLGVMERISNPADDLVDAGEEAYMQQLSSRDRTLYDQIQREQSLELETYRLAGEYRRSGDVGEKRQLQDALRQKLGESFELKQQIRADEITQAEAQISELRRLLGERESRKAQIIERRIHELIGKPGN